MVPDILESKNGAIICKLLLLIVIILYHYLRLYIRFPLLLTFFWTISAFLIPHLPSSAHSSWVMESFLLCLTLLNSFSLQHITTNHNKWLTLEAVSLDCSCSIYNMTYTEKNSLIVVTYQFSQNNCILIISTYTHKDIMPQIECM